MSTDMFEEREEQPVAEVRVYRFGQLVARVLCESEEEAAAVVEHWSELDGVECEVDALGAHHDVGDILEPGEPSTPGEEQYERPAQPQGRETYG